MPPRRAWIWFFLILTANYLLMRGLLPDTAEPVKVPYTLFKQQVINGNVAAIYSRGVVITGRFAKAVSYAPIVFGIEPAVGIQRKDYRSEASIGVR